ncbi:hypothetical protein D3C76_1302830 [compost metagenome]
MPGPSSGISTRERASFGSLLVFRAFCTFSGRVALICASAGRAKGNSVARARARNDLNIFEVISRTGA